MPASITDCNPVLAEMEALTNGPKLRSCLCGYCVDRSCVGCVVCCVALRCGVGGANIVVCRTSVRKIVLRIVKKIGAAKTQLRDMNKPI